MNKFTKTTNLQITHSIKIDGIEYKNIELKKIFQNGLKTNIQYDSTVTYNLNDICTKDGSIYISMKQSNKGNSIEDENYWKQYLLRKQIITSWNNDFIYSKNAWVSYEGDLYKSLKDGNENNIPSIDSEYWHKFISGNTVQSINLRGTYNKFAKYFKNDVVRNRGCLWFCYNDENGQGIQRKDPPLVPEDETNLYWRLYLVDGLSSSITIGKVETVQFDNPAQILNVGNKYQAVLDFKIPRGYDGKNAYQLWLQQGNVGSINDFYNWLRSSTGLYKFTNDDLNDGVLTIPYTYSVVGVIDNTGLQWNLPQGSVLKTKNCVYVNLVGIMSMKDVTQIQGEWNIALSGGIKGDNALSFVVGQVKSLSNDQQPKITATQDQNGLVTFNIGIPKGKDALSFKIGNVQMSDKTNVTAQTSEDGTVTLNFQIQKGKDSYLYVAYASDEKGTNFSVQPNNALKYRSQIHVYKAIERELTYQDFKDATWVKYIGQDGAKGNKGDGVYVYIAYASDQNGNDFSFEPDNSLPYRAELHSLVQIENIDETYFMNEKWIRYIGHQGAKGNLQVIYSVDQPLTQGLNNGTIWIPV